VANSPSGQAVPDAASPANPAIADIQALLSAGQLADALALAEARLVDTPHDPDLINAQGCALSAQGRHLEALATFRRAIRQRSGVAGTWNNLGTALKNLKYYRASADSYRKAIALSPAEAFMHHNLALCLAEAGHHGEAISAFSRTLEIDPGYKLAYWGRARSYLFHGNYRQGWPDYEIRLATGQVPQRAITAARWRGEVYAGKRLVILAEQGFGDTLWILRYLATIKALGGELVVECQPALYALVSAMRIADQVIPQGDPLPEAELYCYACSLPGLFSLELDLLDGRPYLAASPWRRRRFRALLDTGGKGLKVGVVWSGSTTFGKNADRALSLRKLLQAVDVPGVQLFSLQKGPPEQELAALGEDSGVVDLAPHLNDFADTAAAVAELDLIIMTDSAVAHLAGALGKPVWVLLGYSAHWLWLQARADSPWYASMRLFRPRFEDDWTHVLDNVAVELMSLAEARRPSP
jgi:tetratricopeptide (TPR) repeat protein